MRVYRLISLCETLNSNARRNERTRPTLGNPPSFPSLSLSPWICITTPFQRLLLLIDSIAFELTVLLTVSRWFTGGCLHTGPDKRDFPRSPICFSSPPAADSRSENRAHTHSRSRAAHWIFNRQWKSIRSPLALAFFSPPLCVFFHRPPLRFAVTNFSLPPLRFLRRCPRLFFPLPSFLLSLSLSFFLSCSRCAVPRALTYANKRCAPARSTFSLPSPRISFEFFPTWSPFQFVRPWKQRSVRFHSPLLFPLFHLFALNARSCTPSLLLAIKWNW